MFWFFFFLVAGILSSTTKDPTHIPYIEGEVLIAEQPGKSHQPDLYKIKFGCAWGMQMLSGEESEMQKGIEGKN